MLQNNSPNLDWSAVPSRATVRGQRRQGLHARSRFARLSDIDRSRRSRLLRLLGVVRIVDFGGRCGSDYGSAPGSLGVEFTITSERGVGAP